MPKKIFYPVVATIVTLLSIFTAILYFNAPDKTNGRLLKSPRSLSNFELVATDGSPVNKSFFLGKWSVVTFGYASCPDVCPTALSYMKQERETLNAHDTKPQFVFISVDPDRDDPEKLGKFVKYFDEGITALTASHENLEKITKDFSAYYSIEKNGDEVVVSHSPYFYIVNPQGNVISFYGPPMTKGAIASDLTELTGKKDHVIF